MTDRDLDRLKSLPVPPPRPEAKAAAIAAARAAFARHAAASSVEENIALPSQGNLQPARHTHASPNPRRTWMRAPKTFAMAASIAALCVAAPTLLYLTTRKAPDRIAAVPAPGNAPADGRTVVAVAPLPAPPALRVEQQAAEADRKTKADELSRERSDAGRLAAAPVPTMADKPLPSSPSTVAPSSRDQLGPSAPPARLREEKREGQLSLGAVPPPASAPAATGFIMPARPQADSPGRRNVGGQMAVLAPPAPPEPFARPPVEQGRDRFEAKEQNPVKSVAAEPVSTFSIDVDTASYSFVRRSLNAGRLPPKSAVRVEEMINYFPYDYARPESATEPFRAEVQVFPSPWNASNQLLHIGLKGYELKSAERPRANLVFLVDVSGSMGPEDRLPLLRNAFRMLLDNLKPDDTVAIVTYASGSDVRLAPTKVAERARIVAAIDSLRAGGSTAGAQGITDAYKVAEANFDKAAVNRVILATDGDWNVGITNRDELKGFIERKRETGIYLSILGVGMGNHNDALMQTLAQSGNGAAAYIDTLNEARKVLVDEASSTLFPIARDVKIQLEFNPARVLEYRLVGYETRMLRREDFNNDKVDAGDVGSGHSVTAIYEITPVGAPRLVDELRYQPQAASAQAPPPAQSAEGQRAEIGFLKLRYKLPKEEASRLATFAIGPAQMKRTIAEASTEARFSTAVAAFGQLLGGQTYMKGYTYDDVIALANGAKGEDAFGYRAELVNLVRLAKSAAASVAPR